MTNFVRGTVFAALSLMLVGCGVDGEPVQPTVAANVGVSSSGAHIGGAVGLNRGPLGVYLGF